jgi:hypothetical protein
MKCFSCGADNIDGAATCQNCGAPLNQRPQFNLQKRDIAKAIIFSIITLGIYALYWFVKMNDEVNQSIGNPNDTPGVTALILTIVTCGIYGIYWAYKKGEVVDNYYANKGMPKPNNAVIYLVLCLFGLSIVTYALLQNELNKAAEGAI